MQAKWDTNVSFPFTVTNMIRQEGVLSPYMSPNQCIYCKYLFLQRANKVIRFQVETNLIYV